MFSVKTLKLYIVIAFKWISIERGVCLHIECNTVLMDVIMSIFLSLVSHSILKSMEVALASSFGAYAINTVICGNKRQTKNTFWCTYKFIMGCVFFSVLAKLHRWPDDFLFVLDSTRKWSSGEMVNSPSPIRIVNNNYNYGFNRRLVNEQL